MTGFIGLLTMAVMGVDVGWQPLAGGGFEYIVQIDPATLAAMQDGQDLVSELPPELQNVRRYRITFGAGALPRLGNPPQNPGTSNPGGSPNSSPSTSPGGSTTSPPNERTALATNPASAGSAAPAREFGPPDERPATPLGSATEPRDAGAGSAFGSGGSSLGSSPGSGSAFGPPGEVRPAFGDDSPTARPPADDRAWPASSPAGSGSPASSAPAGGSAWGGAAPTSGSPTSGSSPPAWNTTPPAWNNGAATDGRTEAGSTASTTASTTASPSGPKLDLDAIAGADAPATGAGSAASRLGSSITPPRDLSGTATGAGLANNPLRGAPLASDARSPANGSAAGDTTVGNTPRPFLPPDDTSSRLAAYRQDEPASNMGTDRRAALGDRFFEKDSSLGGSTSTGGDSRLNFDADDSPSDLSRRTSLESPSAESQNMFSLTLTTLMLFCSIGGNVYLGYTVWGLRQQMADLIDRVKLRRRLAT